LEAPDGEWLVRFLGEGEPNDIDGRQVKSLNVQLDVYRGWVSYFRRKASARDWTDVRRMEQRGRSVNYYSELGGRMLEPVASPEALFEELFARLVETERPVHTSAGSALDIAIEEVLTKARISPERHVLVDGRYSQKGTPTQIEFEMGYRNGQLHLLDQVPATPKQGLIRSRDLLSRMIAARNAGSAKSFVAFYSTDQAHGRAGLDEVLLPLEGQARTIDVDDRDEAAATVRSIVADD
jgi:hypothetical protein